MASRTAELILRLVDQVTGPARAVNAALRGVNQATRLLGDSARTTRRAATDMAGLSVPLLMIGNDAARQVFEFEKVGNALQAVTGMTADQREQMEQLANDLNVQFPATNTEILQAAVELGKSGMQYEEIRGSLKNVLNLALAGDFGIPDSSAVLIATATAMRMSMDTELAAAESTAKVADMIAYTANKSLAEIPDVGVTMRYVASAAAATGMTLDELGATTAVLAQNGIMGSNAGTGLRYALLQLLNPSKAANAAFAKLNINLGDYVHGAKQVNAADLISNLSLDGIDATALTPIKDQIQAILDDPAISKSPARLAAALSPLMQDALGGDGGIFDSAVLAQSLNDSLSVLGTEVDFMPLMKAFRDNPQSESLFGAIFGKQHAVKMMALLAGDLDGVLADFTAHSAGAADRMSSQRLLGVVGDWYALTAAVENFYITLGSTGILSDAASVMQTLADTLNHLGQTSPELLKLGIYAAGVLAVMAPLGWILSGIAGTIAFIASPIVLVVAALGALAYFNWDGIVSFFGSFKEAFSTWFNPQSLKPVTDALNQFKTAFAGIGQGIDFGAMGGDLGKFTAQLINKLPDLIAFLTGLRDQAQPVIDIIQPMFQAFGDAVGAIAGAIGRLTVGAAQGIIAFFQGFADNIDPNTIETLLGAGRAISGFAQAVWKIIEAMANNIGTSDQIALLVASLKLMGQGVALALDLAVGAINAVVNGLKWLMSDEARNGISAKMYSIADTIVNAVGGIDLMAIGKHIIDTLIAGIVSAIPGVAGEMKGVQDAIYVLSGGAMGGSTAGSQTTGSTTGAVINGQTDMGLAPTGVQARASGGSFGPGWVLRGEKGPELEHVSRSGHIYNANDTKDMLSGKNRGGGDTYHTWNISGSNAEEIARKVSSLIDTKLQRSRGLSMDGRMEME